MSVFPLGRPSPTFADVSDNGNRRNQLIERDPAINMHIWSSVGTIPEKS
jgi:hypothetical protein